MLFRPILLTDARPLA